MPSDKALNRTSPNKIAEAKRLKDWILRQGEDDPEMIRDMIEGETDLFQIRDWAIKKYLDEQAFAEAIKGRCEALSDRKKASEARAEKMRLILTDIMNVTGEKSYRGPEATVSVRASSPKLIVTDENLIPDEYWKLKKEVSKTALNEASEKGIEIPGTAISNGGQTLTIRSK